MCDARDRDGRLRELGGIPNMCRVGAPIASDFALVAFAFFVLVGTEVALIITVPGANYGGADGKAAQAEILATLEFGRPFDISNLNPLQGLGSNDAHERMGQSRLLAVRFI